MKYYSRRLTFIKTCNFCLIKTTQKLTNIANMISVLKFKDCPPDISEDCSFTLGSDEVFIYKNSSTCINKMSSSDSYVVIMYYPVTSKHAMSVFLRSKSTDIIILSCEIFPETLIQLLYSPLGFVLNLYNLTVRFHKILSYYEVKILKFTSMAAYVSMPTPNHQQ